MSLPGLLDHTANVWRPTEALGPGRAKVNTYAKLAGREDLALVPPGETRSDEGAGEAKRGLLSGYMSIGAIAVEEDVLEVTDGPEAPVNLRLLTLIRPRNHHIEFTAERYTGTLP